MRGETQWQVREGVLGAEKTVMMTMVERNSSTPSRVHYVKGFCVSSFAGIEGVTEPVTVWSLPFFLSLNHFSTFFIL